MGARSLENLVCALCGLRNSTRDGEHVFPQWFLKRYLPVDPAGGYTTEVDGESLKNRKGTPRKHSWPEVRLPACEPCNQALRDRFEVGISLAAAKKLFDEPAVALTAPEAELAALWILKTWTFLAHPNAVHVDGHPRPSWDLGADVWGWTSAGAAPPATLSAWITRQDITAEPRERIDVDFSGELRDTQIYQRRVTVLNGFLHEPVDRRFVDSSRQLWPPTNEPFDFGALPTQARSQYRWIQRPRLEAIRYSE